MLRVGRGGCASRSGVLAAIRRRRRARGTSWGACEARRGRPRPRPEQRQLGQSWARSSGRGSLALRTIDERRVSNDLRRLSASGDALLRTARRLPGRHRVARARRRNCDSSALLCLPEGVSHKPTDANHGPHLAGVDSRRLRQGGAQGGQPHGGATGQVAQVEPQDASRLPRKAASAYALCAAVLERATRLLRRPIFQTKKFLTKS